MKFAYSTPTADEAQRCVLFDNYQRIGYDGLELKCDQFADDLDDPQRFKDAWGDRPGVAAGLITGGRLDEEGLASLRQVFSFAAVVGAELVIYCHGASREGMTRDDLKAHARAFSQIGKEALQAGAKLSLHNHFNNPVMTHEDIEAFFGAADTDAIGLTVDTAHLAKSGVDDIAGVIRDFAGAIDNFHLKDFVDGQWRVLGEGAIDFGPIFQAIREVGYDGWVSTDEESGADILAAMTTCYAFMKDGLPQALSPGG